MEAYCKRFNKDSENGPHKKIWDQKTKERSGCLKYLKEFMSLLPIPPEATHTS